MTENRLTGKVPAEAVHKLQERIPKDVITRFLALRDMTSTVSDALDDFGLQGAIAGSVLRPTIPGARVAGTAITVRNVPRVEQPYLNIRALSTLAEMEGHNQAEPGDVLVIQGVRNVSNMGGMSATIGQREGEVGAIVDGGIRDVPWQREIGFPVWSADVTPVTGKWRVKTVEVNGPVTIQGVIVRAGDLALADDTGVCFVPAAMVTKILERAEEIDSGEGEKYTHIREGIELSEFATKHYSYYLDDRDERH